MSYHVAVISAGRPGSVPAMLTHLGDMPSTWYVPDGEGADYRYTGGQRIAVIESGGLCASRNAALDTADRLGLPCLQLSDDLVKLELAHGPTRADVEPTTLADVVSHLSAAMATNGAQLAGVAPTANPYFSRQRINPTGFVVGDLILVAEGCPLRFDTELRLKEDYDYTCQHLEAYGRVARCDHVLASFKHRTNKGGAVAVRTPEVEQASIARLLDRWPAHIRPNPKRPNEVLLRWKPNAASTLPGPIAIPRGSLRITLPARPERAPVGRDWQQPAPFAVQVEAVEGCNLRCGFCGIRGIREKGATGELSGPYNYMTPATARALADGMANLGWSARIEFAMHGEPTLHPHLPDLVRTFRRRLPMTSIMVTTNGLPLLDGDGLLANLGELYLAGVNVVALDDYAPHRVAPLARQLGPGIADVVEYPADPDGNPHRRRAPGARVLSIVADIAQATDGTHAQLGNHAGAAAAPTTAADGKPCAKPFRELSIRWDGGVAICCNDWRGTYKIGNVVADGLAAVWQHPRFQAARRFLVAGQRRELDPCGGCDHTSYRVGLLPDQLGKVQLPPADAADADLAAEATGGPTLTPVVLRRWETP